MKQDSSHRHAHVAIAAAMILIGLGGILAAPALGSSWTDRQLGGEAAKVTMFGISCPSTSLCVAVGGNNTIASSTDPADGKWGVVYAGEGAISIGSNFRQIRGVSCPSPQLCVAVTFEGLIYAATNPTGGADAWSVTDLDGGGPNTHLYGVSCPTVSFCAAAAGKGKIVTSTNPTGGASAWSVTQLEGPLELRGISCLSPALCVAVGDDGERANPSAAANGVILSSTNPLGGVWQRVSMPGGQGPLYGVSCPSGNFCLSGNLLGNLLVSTNPTGPASAWPATDGGGSVQITAASCPSTSRCVAIDNNGDVLTSTDPTGGPRAWTFTNLVPFPTPGLEDAQANGMFGVSCPSVSFCAIAAAKGQIFTSSDPFAATPAPPAGGQGTKKKHRRIGPKRPGTKIARPPLNGIETVRTKVRTRTFFYARNRVHVNGFLCGIDGSALKRCRSPKSYTVGLGRHVIRIRAIGRTGLKGPVAVARFRVCHPTTHGFCQGRPVSAGE